MMQKEDIPGAFYLAVQRHRFNEIKNKAKFGVHPSFCTSLLENRRKGELG